MTASPPELLPGQAFFPFFQQVSHYLKTRPNTFLVLHFEDYEQFNCSSCAQCCIVPWSVGVTKAWHDAWEPFFNNHPDPRFHQIFQLIEDPPPGSINYANLRKHPNSTRCVLLDDDNLCWLHKHHGADAKPATCTSYPRVSRLAARQVISNNLMRSCQSTARQLGGPNSLKYYYETRLASEEIETFMAHLNIDNQVFITAEGLYHWLGLAMDVVTPAPGSSPEEANVLNLLRHLHHTLTLLADSLPQDEHTQWVLNPLQFQAIYREQMRQQSLAPLIPPKGKTREVLPWVLKYLPRTHRQEELRTYFNELLQGTKPIPHLEPEEIKLMNHFAHNYLRNRIVAPHYWYVERGNLFQDTFSTVLFITLLHLICLFYRFVAQEPINLEMLRQAINLIEGNLAQNRVWFKMNGFADLTREQCLQAMEMLLGVDVYRGLEL